MKENFSKRQKEKYLLFAEHSKRVKELFVVWEGLCKKFMKCSHSFRIRKVNGGAAHEFTHATRAPLNGKIIMKNFNFSVGCAESIILCGFVVHTDHLFSF